MPAKVERCVRRVKRRGNVKNPYAICNAAVKRESHVGKKKEK